VSEVAPVFFSSPAPEWAPITGGFGDWYTGNDGTTYQHRGVDYGLQQGTPLVAPASGRIVKIYPEDSSFGNAPVIDHGPEYEFRFSVIAHCSRVAELLDQEVQAGELIALSGNTGLSTGPHVHWQLCRNDWFPRILSYSTDPLPHIISEEDLKKLEDLTLAGYAHPDELQKMADGEMTREEVLAKAEGRVQMIINQDPPEEPYRGAFFALGDHVSLPKHGGAASADHDHGGQTKPHRHEPGEVISE
jgi:hypothetical protein